MNFEQEKLKYFFIIESRIKILMFFIILFSFFSISFLFSDEKKNKLDVTRLDKPGKRGDLPELYTDSIFCAIGENLDEGTRGILHLWKGGYNIDNNTYDAPLDVMWWGEFDYVKVDDEWFLEDGEEYPDDLFGIKDNAPLIYAPDSSFIKLTFEKPLFTVIKKIEPLKKIINDILTPLPVIRVTYKIKNTAPDNLPHNYTIYHSEDYSLGGIHRDYHGEPNNWKDNARIFKLGDENHIENPSLISASDTKCVISYLNSQFEPANNPDSTAYTFLGIVEDDAEFYVNKWSEVGSRSFEFDSLANIVDNAVSVGLRYDIGEIEFDEEKTVWFYLGVGTSWQGINDLANLVLGESSGNNLMVNPAIINPPEINDYHEEIVTLTNISNRIFEVEAIPHSNLIEVFDIYGDPFTETPLESGDSLQCIVAITQPSDYVESLDLEFKYIGENLDDSEYLLINILRKAPKTFDFSPDTIAINYDDNEIYISGHVDDTTTGGSWLDSTYYYDNGTTQVSKIGAFALENINYPFIDHRVQIPPGINPGSSHIIYFTSTDIANQIGSFSNLDEYDSIIVNVKPDVSHISPFNGEFRDSIPIILNAGLFDSVYVEWSSTIVLPIWEEIFRGVSDSYDWFSNLNEQNVYFRGRAKKNDLLSDWKMNSTPILIDNLPPITIDSYNLNGIWSNQSSNVLLSRLDNLSGFDNIGATFYSLDGSGPDIEINFPFFINFNNFNGYLKYKSIDDAGNIESVKTKRIKIDVVSPLIETEIDFPDFNMNSIGEYNIELKILDRFSGLISDSTLITYSFGDDPEIIENLVSTDSIFNFSINEPVGGWITIPNTFLHISITAIDSALNNQNLFYSEFIEYINQPPQFDSNIDDQNIFKFQDFTQLRLNDYIIDENIDSLEWNLSHTNSTNFIITLDENSIFNLSPFDSTYIGSDIVIFNVTDDYGITTSDTAEFTVLDTNYVPIIFPNIPGQAVIIGETFEIIELNNFVSDLDHLNSELNWNSEFLAPLQVSIDNITKRCSVFTADNNLLFEQTIELIVSDPLGERDTSFVEFKRGDFPLTVYPIDNQKIDEDNSFRKIDLDDYYSTTLVNPIIDWTYSFSIDNVNFFVNDPSNKFSISQIGDSTEVICPADSNGVIFIKFVATTNSKSRDLYQDSTIATYTVNPVNDIPYFSAINSQEIAHDNLFQIFNLNDLVIDIETPNGPFEFSAIAPPDKFDVNIDNVSGNATVTQVNPSYNGIVEDSILFRVTDSSLDFSTSNFYYKVNADTLRLVIDNQTISENEYFENYSFNNIIFDFLESPLDIEWNFEHISGDSITNINIDLNNGRIEVSKKDSITYGIENIAFTVYDELLNQAAIDTVQFIISHINGNPMLLVQPSEKLSIEQGEDLFDLRIFEIFDNEDPRDSIEVDFFWKQSDNNSIFTLDLDKLENDTVMVTNLMPYEFTGNDTLVLIATDTEQLADTIFCEYEVITINTVPILSQFPVYYMGNNNDSIIYLDRFVTDDQADSLISWSFEADSDFFDFETIVTDPDSGQFVEAKIINSYLGSKRVKFIATDPYLTNSSQYVSFVRGVVLDSIEVRDTTNTTSLLSSTFLNDNFASVKFFADVDSARAGIVSILDTVSWLPVREDSTIILEINFDNGEEKNLLGGYGKEATFLNIYAQAKLENEITLVKKDSIIFDNTLPSGSFYLESLDSNQYHTNNDTVRIKIIDIDDDIYRYGYSQTGGILEGETSLWEDSLRTKFVLLENDKLYISLKDSAGNVFTYKDSITILKSKPGIVLVAPDLEVLEKRNYSISRSFLNIVGYDSSKTMKELTISYRNNLTHIQRDQMETDSLVFDTKLENISSIIDTVYITSIDSAGNTDNLHFPIVYEPKKHYVLTLNNDGINDISYFNTSGDNKATVDIFSLRGDHIIKLSYSNSTNESPFWDGKGENGDFVTGGLYIYHAVANGKEITGTISVVR